MQRLMCSPLPPSSASASPTCSLPFTDLQTPGLLSVLEQESFFPCRVLCSSVLPLCLEYPCLGSSQILVLPGALLDPSLHYFWLPLCLQLKLSTELFFSVLVCLALFGSFKKTAKTSKARLCSPQAFSSLSFLSSGRTCFKHKFILIYTRKYESHMNIWNVYGCVFVAYCFGFLPMVPCFLCTWFP